MGTPKIRVVLQGDEYGGMDIKEERVACDNQMADNGVVALAWSAYVI